MKTRILLAVAVLGIAGTASAVQISNLNGQTCGAQTGLWHFVNNQTGLGAPTGTITATFSGSAACITSATAVNQRTQHFYCVGTGALLSAQTDLQGRLVLSDYTCGITPPPPCDPKDDPKCEPPK